MKLWLVAALLICPATQDAEVAELLRRLDDEDSAVREAASASLRKLGMRAAPELEEALVHSSAEVRARAATILGSLPEYALKCVLDHPEFPAVRRLWNGIIDALIAKKQISESLWTEFGREGKEAKEVPPDHGPPARHGGAWIFARLREDGTRALNALAKSYGIVGKEFPSEAQAAEESGSVRPLSGKVASVLLAIGVDESTFEELYGTILVMHGGLLALWFGSLTDEGWEVVLRVLVQIRRKGEAKPMSPPAGREEALNLVLRGPWIRGIASALGRAFATEKAGGGLQFSWGIRHASGLSDIGADPLHTKELAAIYHKMVRLDKTLGMVYFHPVYLGPRPAQLPPPRYLSIIDRDVLLKVPGQGGMETGTRSVVEAIVATMNLFEQGVDESFLAEKYDAVMLRLIPAVASHVVEGVRR